MDWIVNMFSNSFGLWRQAAGPEDRYEAIKKTFMDEQAAEILVFSDDEWKAIGSSRIHKNKTKRKHLKRTFPPVSFPESRYGYPHSGITSRLSPLKQP